MEGAVVSLWLPFLLFVGLQSASAQAETVYTAVNGTIRLKPESSGPFSNILWKHKGNLVVEWARGDLDYYSIFRGRTTLDTTTGALEIKNTNASFTGLYNVELNSQVQKKDYNVEFIKEVPKPEITVRPLSCSSDRDNCTLLCGHVDISGAEPLTYSWRKGAGEWSQGENSIIIKKDETKKVQNFTCQVKNPISEAKSGAYNNPFYEPDSEPDSGVVVGYIFGVLLPLAAVAGGFGVAWNKGKLNQWIPERWHRGPGGNPSANRNGAAGNPSPTETDHLSKDPQTPVDMDTENPPGSAVVTTNTDEL